MFLHTLPQFPKKSTREMVEFFYLWKRTPDASEFKRRIKEVVEDDPRHNPKILSPKKPSLSTSAPVTTVPLRSAAALVRLPSPLPVDPFGEITMKKKSDESFVPLLSPPSSRLVKETVVVENGEQEKEQEKEKEPATSEREAGIASEPLQPPPVPVAPSIEVVIRREKTPVDMSSFVAVPMGEKKTVVSVEVKKGTWNGSSTVICDNCGVKVCEGKNSGPKGEPLCTPCGLSWKKLGVLEDLRPKGIHFSSPAFHHRQLANLCSSLCRKRQGEREREGRRERKRKRKGAQGKGAEGQGT